MNTVNQYELEKPAHLTDEYELYGPNNLLVVSGKLAGFAADSAIYLTERINSIAAANSLPESASCPDATYQYNSQWDTHPIKGISARRRLRQEWPQNINHILEERAEGDIALIPNGPGFTIAAALILGQAVGMGRGDVYLFKRRVPDMYRRNPRVQSVNDTSNLFGWRAPNSGKAHHESLKATPENFVGATR